MKTTLKFQNIDAAPGSKVQGYVSLPHAKCSLPAAIINGTGDGKTLLITAGVHGFEYPGIAAARELAFELEPSCIDGAVVILPVINSSGFYGRLPYVCADDERRSNLNRLSPGNYSGTFGEKLLADLYEIFVSQADFHVDLHSGDATENLSGFAAAGNTPDPEVREMVHNVIHHTNFHYYTQSGGVREFYNGSALSHGTPSMMFELGGAGAITRGEVNSEKSDLRRIAQCLKILPGEPELNREQIFLKKQSWISCGKTGFFEAFVRCGDTVSEGQKVFEIRDVFGKLLETHFALHDGIVMILNRTLGVSEGDDAVFYARP